jgi:hypothetical protein
MIGGWEPFSPTRKLDSRWFMGCLIGLCRPLVSPSCRVVTQRESMGTISLSLMVCPLLRYHEIVAYDNRAHILAWTRSQGHAPTSKICRDQQDQHRVRVRVEITRGTTSDYRPYSESRSSGCQIPLRLPCSNDQPRRRNWFSRYSTPISSRQFRTCSTMFCSRD